MPVFSPYSKAHTEHRKGHAMFQIFAKTFRTATRNDSRTPPRGLWDAPSHWARGERFDNRRDAEIEAHLAGRRF